jgi:hypothetical protein
MDELLECLVKEYVYVIKVLVVMLLEINVVTNVKLTQLFNTILLIGGIHRLSCLKYELSILCLIVIMTYDF